jgi:cytochrome c5
VRHQKGSTKSTFIASLLTFAIIVGIVAYNLINAEDPHDSMLSEEQETARIAPVGAVTTDTDVAAGEAAAKPAVVVQTVIEEPPFDAEAAYKSVCFACHDTGAALAPKLLAADWTDRMTKGEETLIANAINGIGMMPPKGGRMTLTDDEVTAIVVYMISKIQE